MSLQTAVPARAAPTFRREAFRLVSLIAVQLFPLVVLALVYPSIAVTIHTKSIGGVPLAKLMASAAVVGPLLAQTVSAPIYRLIDGVDRHDSRGVSRATLRALPVALTIGLPLAGAAAWLLADLMRWGGAATAAFMLVVELHLVLASLLVPAYAAGSHLSLVIAWGAYATVLHAIPTTLWAAPLAAICTQVPLLLWRAGRASPIQRVAAPSALAVLAATVRGFADATPLWCVPLAVFAAAPSSFAAGPVFAGMLPAIIAYHVFFQTAAEPMWRRIGRLRRDMGLHPFSVIEREVGDLKYRARLGVFRVLSVEALLGMLTVMLMGALQWDRFPLFLAVLGTSDLAVVLLAEVYTLSMLRNSPPVLLTAAVIVALIVTAIVNGLGVDQMLLMLAVTFVVMTAAIGLLSGRVWQLPEHALFWKTALAQ
ncbi:hypothetical protein [uncultured Amnibacterium sp.]|uniref:hypothetical protein n=1 Tax=uncultured Amnibacterium sp. TaxID=1631851 RepID=UPI0035CC88E8